MQNTNTETREDLSRALGRIASGVHVVTMDSDAGPHGILASFVAQVAFEPPVVTIAVSAQRPILNDMEGATLTINILAKTNMDIFKAFARPAKTPDDNRFEGLKTVDNPEGAIAFADAVAILNAEVRQLVPAGDHVVVFAEVKSGRALNADAEPMIHLRKNGFGY